MRTVRSLLILLAVLAAVAVPLATRLSAQDATQTLLVSGLRIGGREKALLRFRNVSPAGGDTYFMNVVVRTLEGGELVSLTSGVQLRARDTIELDVAELVAVYRTQLGASGDFAGPVQVLITGAGGVSRPFGGGTVYAKALQRRGTILTEAETHWR